MNLFSLMTLKSETKCLEHDCTIRQALEKMDYYKYSVVPLLNEEGEYIGTLSEGDLLRYIKNDCDFDLSDAEDVNIQTIHRYRSYKALSHQASTEDLIHLSIEQNFIPIVDDRNIFMGIITRSRIMQLCKNEMKKVLNDTDM